MTRAELLKRQLDDREQQEMGENGRRAVEEKFNWERESAKLLRLYGRLLDLPLRVPSGNDP